MAKAMRKLFAIPEGSVSGGILRHEEARLEYYVVRFDRLVAEPFIEWVRVVLGEELGCINRYRPWRAESLY